MLMVGNGVWGLSWFSRLGSFLGATSYGGGGGGGALSCLLCIELAGLSL
jgi:hypothetical protein